MKDSLKNIWQKSIHLGVSKLADDTKMQQLVNFNAILVFGALILLLSISTNVISLTWSVYDNIIYIGGASLISLCLFLNTIGRFGISVYFANIGFTLIFCAAAVFSGDLFICCLVNVLLMVVTFRFLASKRENFISSILQLIFVIITIFIVDTSEYSSNEFDPLVRSIVYVLMFIFLFSHVSLFKDQIRSNLNKINGLVQELEHKNTKVELAYHEMENFAHKISHDLKAPLRNMNTYATLLKKDVHRKKEDNLENYSDQIYKNGVKLSKMIDDVLAYSKLNAKQTETIELIKLKEVIEPIRNDMKLIYPNAEIRLLRPGELEGSKIKFHLLLQNLIENGLKYNTSESPLIEVDFLKQNGSYNITVKDNGIGIDEQYQDQIFELFSRLHSDQEYEGTGIGLSTCQKIVDGYFNGNIKVASEVNKGTTFNITIPSGNRTS